jgi:hypothetical protein
MSRIPWMGWSRMGLAKEKGGLGYRDLECFNQAMLAKQGWCLIKHPSSLMAQMLKPKYFPIDGFLDSKLGSHPSFAWRSSIWNAKELLKEGMEGGR